jgi:hypothetical protein
VRRRSPPALALAPALLSLLPSLVARGADAGGDLRALDVPTRTGSIGLLTQSTADLGPAGSAALAVHASYAQNVGLLVAGERNIRADGDLAFSFTPSRNLEVFADVVAFGDQESAAPALPGGSAVGERGGANLLVGAKAATPLGRRLRVGPEVGVEAPGAFGGFPASLSAWASLLASLDLTSGGRMPLRAHLSFGYLRDGSRARFDFTGLPEATREVALYAYAMGADRVRAALGLDASIRVDAGRFTVRPLAEYHVEIVTAGPDVAFRSDTPFNRDQHWVVFGLRTDLTKALALDLGTEIAFRSVGVPYGPPLAPYRLLAGAAFVFR